MKKILLIIISLTLLFGCGQQDEKKKLDEGSEKISNVKKPSGPVLKLRYKFTPGDKFSYSLHTSSHNTEEIIADTTLRNEITQNATYRFDFVVKEIDEFKNANLEVRINSIVAETNFNGESLKYDSKYIYSTRERAQFVDYEAVKKIPFKISVNKIGQVVKVDKINRIMKNILDIQKVPDTLSAKSKEKMRLNIANGTLMPLTQQIFKVITDNEVGIDSVWQLKYTTPLAVFNVENTAISRITDLDFNKDTTVSISSDLLINVLGNNVVNENGMTYTFAQPQLNAEGTVNYNNSRGLVQTSTLNTKLELSMVVDGFDSNNNRIQSTKRDISNSTNIVELL